MNEISQDEALIELRRRESLGHHVDARVWRDVASPGRIFTMTLATIDEFLNLIWQEACPARLLTPKGESRTLRDVGHRLMGAEYSFESLATGMGLPRSEHHPEWFVPCVAIDRAFDFDQFGWLVLTPATEDERRQSPAGEYYIFDGIHKSVVLAKRLLEGSITFRPLEALLLTPRRD
jgi:hypothetical protein